MRNKQACFITIKDYLSKNVYAPNNKLQNKYNKLLKTKKGKQITYQL